MNNYDNEKKREKRKTLEKTGTGFKNEHAIEPKNAGCRQMLKGNRS